jgi:REP element-mobilizing transposase RayT
MDLDLDLDRYWFLTWTTYGTWLPGDKRGFVSNVRDGPGPEIRHNTPGTPFDADLPPLEQAARSRQKGPPIRLDHRQAEILFEQMLETSGFRSWLLMAVGIMANHCHLVVAVPGDPDPSKLLQDFKSYGSRVLNQRWGKPASGTWWTDSGSKRKLPDEQAILGAISYVVQQQYPLVLWTIPVPELNLIGGRIDCNSQREP